MAAHLGRPHVGVGQQARVCEALGVAYALEGVASLAVLQGQPKRAVRLYSWCWALRESLDVGRYPVEQDEVDRDFVTIRALLDEAAFAAAWAEGRALTLEHAIAEALNR